MADDDTYTRTMAIVRDVVDLDHCIDGTTPIADIEGWDSLVSVNTLLSLEETFDIEIPQERYFGAESISEIVALLEQCLKSD